MTTKGPPRPHLDSANGLQVTGNAGKSRVIGAFPCLLKDMIASRVLTELEMSRTGYEYSLLGQRIASKQLGAPVKSRCLGFSY